MLRDVLKASNTTAQRDEWSIANALGFRSFPELARSRVKLSLGDAYSRRVIIFAPAFVQLHATINESQVALQTIVGSEFPTDRLTITYYFQDRHGDLLVEESIECATLPLIHTQPQTTL